MNRRAPPGVQARPALRLSRAGSLQHVSTNRRTIRNPVTIVPALLGAVVLAAVPALAAPTLEVALDGQAIRVKPGDTVSLTLKQDNLDAPGCAGYQAFLSYDTQKLTFTSGDYTGLPYPVILQSNMAGQAGELNLAAGITPGGQQTTQAATLANLHFQAGAQEGAVQVTFRTASPPSQFSSFNGAVAATLVNGPEIIIDASGPALSAEMIPPAAISGQQVQIEVTAIDGAGVTGVNLDGQPMTLDNGVWKASTIALAAPGQHALGLQATDGLGNNSTGSATYTTATPVYINNRDASNPPADAASSHRVFALVGRAQSVNADDFILDDGGGYPIKVLAPGHGVQPGSLVKAAGWLEPGPPAPQLHSASQYIAVLQ